MKDYQTSVVAVIVWVMVIWNVNNGTVVDRVHMNKMNFLMEVGWA